MTDFEQLTQSVPYPVLFWVLAMSHDFNIDIKGYSRNLVEGRRNAGFSDILVE